MCAEVYFSVVGASKTIKSFLLLSGLTILGIGGPPVPGAAAPVGTGRTVCPERMPTFPGNLNAWLAANLQYPEAARRAEVQGRVIVRFVITEQGRVTELRVVKSPSVYLTFEAVRIMCIMPRWQPGMQNCKPTKVRYTLPLNFQLG